MDAPTARSPPPPCGCTADGAARLVAALSRASAWPHPVLPVAVVETHVSWILLTGLFAYKIKKPVDLGFLDFSTLERRRQACEEELRLNRRWAPELYLDVVPITGSADAPRVGGDGPALEYAVRMRQFAQSEQLDRRLEAGRLGRGELEPFADALALAHAAAPVAPADGRFGTVAAVRGPVEATLAGLRDRAASPAEVEALACVRAWLEGQPADAALQGRLRDGLIREGHGDLHLANIVLWQDRVQAFDCIEFDPALRWIDVINDVAFLVMDLVCRRRRDLAYAVLNRYLEGTGDYAGLGLLRYYLVYRALVRAHVAAIQRAASGGARTGAALAVAQHLALALAWTEPARPVLVLMHGFSGSGKTHLSGELLAALPAVRVRSDLERKRPGVLAPPAAGPAADYGAWAIDANYARLAALAQAVLAAGENAIVDATFLARAERERFYALARRLRVPCVVVACRAPRVLLEQRVTRRARVRPDASDADVAVLSRQWRAAESLALVERGAAVELDTSRAVDAREVARAIFACARQLPEALAASGAGPAEQGQQAVALQDAGDGARQPDQDQEASGEAP